MAKHKRKPRITRRVEPIVKGAEASRIDFSYRNYEELSKFISDRAKIYGRKRTGLNAKQQRRLTVALKHARHLGLLPFSQDF